MRKAVELLNKAGFKTTDSGDGVTNVEAGMEGALPFPHIIVRLDSEFLTPVFYEFERLEQWLAGKDLGDLHNLEVELSYSNKSKIGLAILQWDP